MRFVSKSPAYSIAYKRDIVEHYATGDSQIIQPLWNCQFSPIGILSHEIDQVKKWAINHGVPKEYDQGPDADMAYRCSVFDTEQFQREHAEDIFKRTPNGFDEAERLKMEEFLIAHQDEYYRVVETVVLRPPWPNYDQLRGTTETGSTASLIAAKVAEDGYDVAAVLAYERSKAKRGDVIAALEELLPAAPEPAELVTA